MKRIAVFSLIMLAFFLQIKSVSACGGGAPYSLIEWVSDTDVIIRATVLEVDDRGFNAILRVDEYFKGGGEGYLVVYRYPASLETGAGVRGYDTSCLYAGYGREWEVGSEGYFAFSANDNGTYTDIESLSGTNPSYFVEDGQVEYYTFDIHKDMEPQYHIVSVAEFEELLLEYGERNEPIAPDIANSTYPLMRFLNITTESGARYQLNPDRSLTVLGDDYPIAISNDGTHIAFRLDDERVGFQYIWLDRGTDEWQDGGRRMAKNGQKVEFSPDSNFVAVWDDGHIALYMFDNYQMVGYGQAMNMQTIAERNLVWSNRDTYPSVAWSSDSTTVAFEDERGIWLWDIFESSEPILAVSNNTHGGTELLDISASGRYVRHGYVDDWTLRDTDTGEIYDNAIATPDERNLIFVVSEDADVPDVNRYGDRDCTVPLATTCPIYVEHSNIQDIFWYKNNQIAFFSCYHEDRCYLGSYSWILAITHTHDYTRALGFQIPVATAVAYDIEYDQPVVAVSGYILEFGFYPAYERDEPSDQPFPVDSVDLSTYLDSPIVHLEWGQPIFYVQR